MTVFVSYTQRDGQVTNQLLVALRAHLATGSKPFVHLLEMPTLHWQQLSVCLAVLRAEVVILIVSPAIGESRWVRFELWLARMLGLPVVPLDIAVLRHVFRS